ncbi:hypothetical protein CGRA01v4_05866 [Colletotrichum graminicola]|nr:hypothetical protein CGRA01v4_05866 [Colletotrichum graminicola]
MRGRGQSNCSGSSRSSASVAATGGEQARHFIFDRGLVPGPPAGDPGEPAHHRTPVAGPPDGGARRGVGQERSGLHPGHDGGILPSRNHAGAGMPDEQRHGPDGDRQGCEGMNRRRSGLLWGFGVCLAVVWEMGWLMPGRMGWDPCRACWTSTGCTTWAMTDYHGSFFRSKGITLEGWRLGRL